MQTLFFALVVCCVCGMVGIWYKYLFDRIFKDASLQKILYGVIILGFCVGVLVLYAVIAYIPASREYLTPIQYQCNISHNCTR